ncbi:MAG: 4a-hydroxytetrahydrobiopterin dehydratase [Anaerolineae bacterium]
MEDLASLHCVPCGAEEPPLTPSEMDSLLPQVPEWKVIERDGVKRLQRIFYFDDFRQALDFTYRVGELAEREGHHPLLVTEWGRVKVTWWTHAIKGLHRNDFIMAARTDQTYATR